MSGKLKLYNALETVVKDVFNNQFSTFNLSCTCEQCQLDVLAITLNKLQPKYVVTEVGVPYVKAQYMNDQDRANIVKILTEAVQIVNQNRNH